MKIEARDLQSALTEASRVLECSVMDLEYQILQHPKNGFLGFGRKNAVIEVSSKKKFSKKNNKKDSAYTMREEKRSSREDKKNSKKESKNTEIHATVKEQKPKESYVVKSDEIFDTFYKESKDTRNIQDVLDEIRIQLLKLLESSGFKIELKEIKMYDEESILICLDGEDAALLIGKEAHRYKAISYLLHSWINLKYNLLVRLEIAQFLENQIHSMQIYIKNIVEKIKVNGRGQTKPLDGVLIKIALEQLRAEFPDKYVGIKQNGNQRFVIINDFLKKDE